MASIFSKSGYLSRRRILQMAMAVPAAAAGAGAIPGFWPGIWNAQAAPGQGKLPIGMNLAGIADWEPGFPFLNVLWGARVWSTRNKSGSGPWTTELGAGLQVDGNGYPLEIPFTTPASPEAQIVFTILPNSLKAGKYVVLFEGEGVIGAGGGTKVLESKPGRVEIYMRHSGGEYVEEITILKSVRGNHIRNMRIVPVEHERTNLDMMPFRPEFLEFCKPWHCLRFMDWLGTNDNTNQVWSERRQRTAYTQVGFQGDALGIFGTEMPGWKRQFISGVAIELCIELANATKKDAWLCVPHMADDTYIENMARLVKDKLDPALKCYVEFSNELWNWQFIQAQWMLRSQIAGDLVAAAGAKPPWKGGVQPANFKNGIVAAGAGEGVDHPERIGALFRRCFSIWERVFSGDDRKRIVRVCSVQSAWTDTVKRTLSWVMKNGGCDALAPAGYFWPDDDVYSRWEAAGAKLTADDVIADMKRMIEQQAAFIKTNARLAKEAGVRLVMYEGGQHIQPKGQADLPYNAALGAVQKHPGIYDLYRMHLDLHAQSGCDLFCAFSSVGAQGSKFGSWGHIEYYGQDPREVPKYRALLDSNS